MCSSHSRAIANRIVCNQDRVNDAISICNQFAACNINIPQATTLNSCVIQLAVNVEADDITKL
ncbi:hypothetical protein, partial [Acinetobacter sp. SA01]|uniref:hypothetical protein n=1 Tax=Acinetobacter sp. SA01 TaxID=1862567 RepID=UPI001F0D02CB